MSGLQWSPFLSVLYSRLVLELYKVLTLYLPELIHAECRMAMLIRHTRLNVTSIYPRINPAYVELACEPAPAKPCRLAQFSGAPRGTGGISGNCRSPPVGFIGPLIAITLGIVGLVLDKYCIGIRVSNEVYKQGSKYCRGRYWEPAPSIPGIFWSTNEYRHDILQQPEPAGGYNRTTNNCECIDCSILVFLDCFLSVL